MLLRAYLCLLLRLRLMVVSALSRMMRLLLILHGQVETLTMTLPLRTLKIIVGVDFSAAAGGRYVKVYDIPNSDLSEGGYGSKGLH